MPIAPNLEMTAQQAAEVAKRAFASAGVQVAACVRESERAWDLAASLRPARLSVIRCVERVRTTDHSALATMMTAGDFVWAGLVYAEREGSGTPGLIETFHVSDLDALASRLSELREAIA